MAAPWAALALAALAAAGATTARAGTGALVVERAEDEIVLLGVRIDRDELDALLPTYSTAAGTLLPLGEFCATLGIGAEVDPLLGTATVRGRRVLLLDAVAGSARLGARTITVTPGSVEIHRDEIYVAADRAAAWLELEIAVDHASASVIVHAPWRLPIQDRAERRQRERLLSEAGGPGMPAYPRIRTQRKLWSVPFVDQTVRTTRLEGPGVRTSRWDYTTIAAGELLYLDAGARLQGNESNPYSEWTGVVGRRDPDPVLLGPLRAREFRFGEVFSDGLALVTLPKTGVGAVVGNQPLERPSQFDRHLFRGHVPPGWDVELFRDRNLVALRTSPADGFYEFDVPLVYGPNAFRLVFHGPQGERREESRVFYVGPALTPPGHHQYQVTVCRPRDSGARVQAEADLSLARRLTFSMSAAQVELDDGTRAFGTGGLRTAWNRVFASLDAAADDANGTAVEGGIQALAGPLGVTVRQARLDHFRSEVFRTQVAPIESRTTGRLDFSFVVAATRAALQAEAWRDGLVDGRTMWRVLERASLGVGAFSISHAVRRTTVEGGFPAVAPETRHTLFVTSQARRWSLRGSMEYDPVRETPLVSMGAVAEGPIVAGNYAALGLDRDEIAGETRAAFNLRRSQGVLGWNVRTEHGPRSGTSVSLALQIGLGRDPLAGRWHAHATSVTTQGAAAARVFVDHNGNGRRDPAEPPVEGAAFEVGTALTPERTGPDGTAFLPNLPENQLVALTLSPASLEDPLWVAATPGVSFVPRAGQVMMLDFPVRATGEIVGAVWMREAGATRPLPGVSVELMDASGNVVKRVRVAYDGWYELLAVLPGTYQVRVAQANAARLRVFNNPARTVTIPVEGTVITGVDLVLDRASLDVMSGAEE